MKYSAHRATVALHERTIHPQFCCSCYHYQYHYDKTS